jgi:hypothetical protein
MKDTPMPNASDAFFCILEEARDPQILYKGPAYIGLLRLITMNGKLPFRHGLASLPHSEANLVMALLGREDICIHCTDSIDYTRCNILVTHSSFGKVTIYDSQEQIVGENETIIGGMIIDQSLLDHVENEGIPHQVMEKKEFEDISALLKEWEASQTLPQKVAQVIDWVDRVESVYIYIGRSLFSRSDAGGNTLNIKPNGILRRLLKTPLDQWTEQERIFIVSMHCLFMTGRAIRFEEFNGRQLSLSELRHWIVQRYCIYSHAAEKEINNDLFTMPLIILAEKVGQLIADVDTSGWMRFRRINGITFIKQEYLLPPDKIAHDVTSLPISLINLGNKLGITWENDALQSVEAITRGAFHHFHVTGSPQYIHRIIEAIVFSAIIEAKADYGMSSSLRIPSRLKGNADQRNVGALSLTKQDFYCCVLPHPHIIDQLPVEHIQHILYSSALRMEFNRWHFIPGNYPREEIPLNRHYYFPPMMPDIAEWSDVRHGGHSKAHVRYSIRVPGAPLWKTPFVAFNHPYRGCYDIRVVRMEGPAFGWQELQIVACHCNIMDTFWKTLQKCIEEYKTITPITLAYTKEWYETSQWKEAIQAQMIN